MLDAFGLGVRDDQRGLPRRGKNMAGVATVVGFCLTMLNT
jgi:hypothetical protein